jgi:hypothetical protein
MNQPVNIYAQIRQERDDFIDNNISIVDGYSFNQYQTIKKCHLYYNSRFVSGELDSNGRKKIFFNIVKSPCKVSTRFLNFDTKDVRLISNTEGGELGTMLLESELKLWLKKNKFANLMNEVAEKLPIYGSVVIKKTKKGAELLDLRKLILDPTVKRIQDSRFVIIEHNLTPSQLRDKEKDGWKNVEEAIQKFYVNKAPDSYMDSESLNQVISTPLIKVYERFGEVPEAWLKEGGSYDKMIRSVEIVCGIDELKKNEAGDVIGEEGITLFDSKWFGDYPLLDAHYDKTDGRWLGIGVVEDLFPIQERTNELTNEKRESMTISSKHIFQTQDRTIVKNILKDLTNGAVLMAGPNGGLTPLANEERNMGAFSNEEARYATQAKELTFAYDAVRGEALPVSTPATNAVIQDRNSSSVFKFKRENLGNMFRDFFNDFVIKQCVKDLTPEHIMIFSGGPEQIAKLDNRIVDRLSWEMAKEEMLSGKLTDQELIKEQLMKQMKEKGANRYILIKDGFYKDLDVQFDINIQNEQEDASVMSQNLFTVLQTLMANPGVLQDPVIRELFYTYAEKIGVSPMKLEMAQQAKNDMMVEQQAQGQLMPGQAPQTGGEAQPKTPMENKLQ